MVNTTDEYWAANGVSLQTYAQNITTFTGRLAPPKFRGEDIVIPYAEGERFIPKVAGSRIITLQMWVRQYGTDAFDDNWRALRNLLWNPKAQLTLQKRFRVAGVVRTASAYAQFNDGLEPSMIGRNGAKFSVDLKLTDPYFYDDAASTFPLVNGQQNIVLPGDAETQRLQLTINGSRTNAIVRNNTLGQQVEYHDPLTSGSTALIDVKAFSATTTPSGGAAFVSTGKVRHTGAPYFLGLAPGTNSITVSSSSGAGTIQLVARGAWI